MSQTLNLFRLQQVDTKINQVNARLQVIQQTLENDLELKTAQQEASSAEEAFNTASKELRNAEEQAKAQRIKIEQIDASLYSGTIKNPKELQELQTDLVSLKKHLATLEDRQIESMLGVEEKQKLKDSAQDNLKKAQVRSLEKNAHLAGEQHTLQKEVEKFQVERSPILTAITPEDLKHYQTLSEQKRGVAVASVNGGDCSACGAPLTPGLQQAAKSPNQIAHCPTCSRILYYG